MTDAPTDAGAEARLLAKVAPLLAVIRGKALRRGDDGLVVLSRALEVKREARNSHRITPEALRAGMLECGIVIEPADATLIVLCFRDAQGFVPILTLMEQLAQFTSPRRKAFVEAVFETLDVNRAGCIDGIDFGSLDFSGHPKVRSGELSEDAARKQMSDTFGSGTISGADFLSYYAVLSETVASDSEFERGVQSAWAEPIAVAEAYRRRINPDVISLIPVIESTMSGTGGSMGSTRNRSLSPGGSRKAEKVPPKRIVGYTGHVPMAKERFGETFHRIEAATPELSKKQINLVAPYVDTAHGMVRKGNKANTHSFKLA